MSKDMNCCDGVKICKDGENITITIKPESMQNCKPNKVEINCCETESSKSGSDCCRSEED
ncbi:MAG: hypothetical protein GY835_08585 [bacterium]|nr:hypothetical protein [bacterium]